MGKMPPPDESELYRRVDEVLYYVWDPIGVSPAPSARDEYDSYLPIIYSAVEANSRAARIAEALVKIEAERLELKPDHGRALRVAEILLDYRKKSVGGTP
jgi:hypothetical protein